jgi:CHAT domain-containing protein/tetratricopeptide (TPR) repeat protein
MLLVAFTFSIKGSAQESSRDSLCALWFQKCAECFRSQQLDEAEKYIVAIEQTNNKEVFVEVAKCCRMNLAFHKAMNRYMHAQYDEALAIATDGLQYLQNKRAKPKELFHLPKLIADCYMQKGVYDEARKIYEDLFRLAIQYDVEDVMAEALLWMANSYQKEDDYEKALSYYKQAYESLYNLESPKSKNAASGLKRLYKYHLFNQEMADYWASKEQDCQKFEKKNSMQDTAWTKYSYLTLAKMKSESLDSFQLKKRQVAVDVVSKWIKGAEEDGCQDSVLLAEAYEFRASFLYMSGKNALAMKDLNVALKLVGNHKDENRELLHRIWGTAANTLRSAKLYEKSTNAHRQAIYNASIVYGKKSLNVANHYKNIAGNEKWQKHYAEQLRNFCIYNYIIKERIRNDFNFLNKQERAAYWQRLGNTISEMPKMIFDHDNTNDLYCDSLYNLILFSKGLLLNAEIEEKTQSDDRKEYLYTQVEDIRHCLSQHSAAVEFCESRYVLDTTLCAVIISRNADHAQLVKLGKKKDVVSASTSLQEIGNMVWAPLKPYLKNIDTVYFSPVGVLNVLPIESSNQLMDNKTLYRLSSTRVLTTMSGHSHHPVNKVAIFGGIDYDVSLPLSKKEKQNVNKSIKRSIRGAVEDIVYLPNTKIEAEQISDCCKQHKLETDCFMADKGTEMAFKSLGMERYNVIHVATHGFYTLPEEEPKVPGQLLKKLREGDQNLQREWQLLQNCGLLMAGAQEYFYDKSKLSENDGILTAQEISSLDLCSVDLVSLSACQTGQGAITGDGVFGLQRGFKKAGANSILMSLWKVDDEATCLLMTEFYKKWIGEKKSKREALELAKQSVRSHKEKEWDDPKYWAAFILLDALD